MSQQSELISCSITDLPAIITSLYRQVGLEGVPQTQDAFYIRYLRRKPGRGLAAMYNIEETHNSHKRHRKAAHNRLISVTLAESSLSGTLMQSQASIQSIAYSASQSGMIAAYDMGITVQMFPVDDKLSMLAECCTTSPSSLLFRTLENVARLHLYSFDWRLISFDAQPIRYKPGSRCVLRYHLILERQQEAMTEQRELTLYGKVYANDEQASNVQAAMQTLYDEQLQEKQQPILPRSYKSGIAGLVVSEAVQPRDNDGQKHQAQTGNLLFRPRIQHNDVGGVREVIIPVEELQLTARALARLHSSTIPSSNMKIRTGKQEAQRARERANLLAAYYPHQADRVQQLAKQLMLTMESSQQITPHVAHGGFKASQLLFHSQQVCIIDFDGLCLADSALDIGYFLAYLRPTGLWYHRSGMRQWFEAAAKMFVQAYRQAMLEQGMDDGILLAMLARSSSYEAALLFKIATRRVNRLNSPRPQEFLAILDEIAQCLSAKEGKE